MALFQKNSKADWLIIGLGNPGPEYADTRHNAGFLVVSALAEQLGVTYWKSECGAMTGNAEYDGMQLVLALPQSFMNLSGGPVAQLMKRYDIPSDHVIVIHDELDIPAGTIRVKMGGGHAGHNGLKSIGEKTGTRDWLRVRVGIGRPPGKQPVADYVLRTPRGEDLEAFEYACAEAVQAVLSLITKGLVATQDAFN